MEPSHIDDHIGRTRKSVGMGNGLCMSAIVAYVVNNNNCSNNDDQIYIVPRGCNIRG